MKTWIEKKTEYPLPVNSIRYGDFSTLAAMRGHIRRFWVRIAPFLFQRNDVYAYMPQGLIDNPVLFYDREGRPISALLVDF